VSVVAAGAYAPAAVRAASAARVQHSQHAPVDERLLLDLHIELPHRGALHHGEVAVRDGYDLRELLGGAGLELRLRHEQLGGVRVGQAAVVCDLVECEPRVCLGREQALDELSSPVIRRRSHAGVAGVGAEGREGCTAPGET